MSGEPSWCAEKGFAMSGDELNRKECNGKEEGHGLSKTESISRLRGEIGKKPSTALEIWGAPWFVWPVYVVSILAGSASAAIVKTIHGIEPLALAGWRHQVSAIVLMPAFVWQLCQVSKSERQKLRSLSTITLLTVSSIGLSANFGAFVWSLEHTSLPHCLFLSSMTPIFVAFYTKITGGTLLRGEIVGVSLGLVGAIILEEGTRLEDDTEASTIGDIVALLSAASVAMHLTAARTLRGAPV